MDKQLLISADHIVKQFKQEFALKDVSFSVHEGQIFGFLGPSGAGKTTTIKILTGQLKATAGTATILGQSVDHINHDLYQKVGIVTHNSGVYEKLSVYDNLLVFSKILNVDSTRIDQVLDQVGLLDQKKKPAGKLSQGMRQRLVFARAVLHQPKVLFLDEPTNGLDPSTAERIHQLIFELKQQGCGIFLTTHNMEEATKLCDQVALLNDGVIAETGSPKELSLRHYSQKKYSVVLKNGTQLELEDSAATANQIFQLIENKQLATIHSNEPTLEKVFLDVTGRELV